MKAIALLSGGLDSTLAIKVVLDHGIEVEAVNFVTPFCQCSRKSGCGEHEAKKVTDRFGIKLKMFNPSTEYLQMLKSPKHGYGKNINPCIDCRILMNKKTKEYMGKIGASFVITGEVLGQRPMSQHKAALKIIEKESGLEGLILRPLSAKLLPLTIPEEKGWINRENLLEISGRSRKPQIALANDYKIGDYPCPAGGCLLTDPGFARRMKDLMNHSEITLNEIELLKTGRHFRLSPSYKLVVGRDKEENEKLLRLARKDDICFEPEELPGPTGIGRGICDKEMETLSARIIAHYTSLETEVNIVVKRNHDEKARVVSAKGIDENKLKELRI